MLQGEGQVGFFGLSESALVQPCLCLTPPPLPPLPPRRAPPFVCTTHTQICTHDKDPIAVRRKRVRFTADGMETRKYCTKKKKTLGSAVLWLLAFPWLSSVAMSVLRLGFTCLQR